MSRILLTVCCLMFIQTATASCNDAAEQARLAGHVQKSIEMLQACLASGLRTVARTYLLLGVAYYQKHDQQNAIASYTRAIDTVPEYPDAWADRGLSKALAGDFKGAVADENRAIELAPHDVHARYFRGYIYDKRGQTEKAIADYSASLDLARTNAVKKLIHFRRGLAYVKQRNNPSALKDFNDAIGLDRNYAEAYFARATLMQNTGSSDAALADYSRVIELDPSDAEARYRRGTIYREKRKDHLAIVDYNHALKIDPHMEKARAGRSYVYLIPILPVLLVLMLG